MAGNYRFTHAAATKNKQVESLAAQSLFFLDENE